MPFRVGKAADEIWSDFPSSGYFSGSCLKTRFAEADNGSIRRDVIAFMHACVVNWKSSVDIS